MCQGGWSALCSIAGQLFVPTVELWRWRAQIKSRSARRAAAKRLDLDVIEHAIRLLWSGVRGTDSSFGQRSKVRAGLAIWVCLPDQTHIRSSPEATAPQFRLRRAGSRGRGHSSLRRLKPCNPSVRPPGSAEADPASADWRSIVEPVLGSRLHGSLDDNPLGYILPQGHKKLARQRDDRALAAPLAVRLEPARQGRLRLVPQP